MQVTQFGERTLDDRVLTDRLPKTIKALRYVVQSCQVMKRLSLSSRSHGLVSLLTVWVRRIVSLGRLPRSVSRSWSVNQGTSNVTVGDRITHPR